MLTPEEASQFFFASAARCEAECAVTIVER
jgi:hypothetical protein